MFLSFYNFSVREVRTFGQSIRFCDCRCSRVDELVSCSASAIVIAISIAYRLVISINLSRSDTNLAVILNRHLCITKHTSELTTTDDGFQDEGCTTNGHISFPYVGSKMRIRILRRILYETLTCTPYPTFWYGTTVCFRPVHTLCRHGNRTNLTAVNENRTFTGTGCAGNRFTNTSVMSCMTIDVDICGSRTSGKCTYRTGIATTKDTVKDIAATHCDIGVAQHVGSITATKDTTDDIGTLSSLRSNVHRGATLDISCITTTKYISDNTQIIGIRRSLRDIKFQFCHHGRNSCIRIQTRYHIDVNRRVGIHDSTFTKAATKYVADIGAGDDVQFGLSVWEGMCLVRWWIILWSVAIICRCSRLQNLLTGYIMSLITLIIAKDRVGSLITT